MDENTWNIDFKNLKFTSLNEVTDLSNSPNFLTIKLVLVDGKETCISLTKTQTMSLSEKLLERLQNEQ